MEAGRSAAVRVGVVIVSWNVRDLLRRCLESLRETAIPVQVVVVDNASADGTAAMVRREFPEVELQANDDNVGFTRGNNQGLRWLGIVGPDRTAAPAAPPVAAEEARGSRPGTGTASATGTETERRSAAAVVLEPVSPPPYVLLLNPDTDVADGALATLVSYVDDHPRAGAVGPELRFPDGTRQSSCRRFPTVLTGLMESTPLEWHWPDNPIARRFRMAGDEPTSAGPVDWVTGAAILLRTVALEEIGLLDEGFFMYSEELDLCLRLRGAGWEVHFAPGARIVHHEGASSSQEVPARHRRFQRSRVRYFRKHHGRLAAAAVRLGILVFFLLEMLLEAAKWLLGHKRPLRRERVAAYAALVLDGLSPGKIEATD